jgi:3-hydroxybutyryl-CoA dehydrogenase
MTAMGTNPPARRTVGICGIGQMGAASAIAFERAGHRVLLWARNRQKLEEVQSSLCHLRTWSVENLGATSAAGTIESTSDLEQIDAESDIVLDCIVEIMSEKTALLRRFSKAVQRDALFLSATSALSITEMAQQSGLASRLVGAHFWNPPHLIPIVEMVRGDQTDPAKLADACELMKQIGKLPIVCKDVPGFVGNRILHAMWREALWMIDNDVCSAQDIDTIVRMTFALRLPLLGPVENMDYVGLDATLRLQKYMGPYLANNQTPAECLVRRVDEGHLGAKSGQGFYDWSQRDIHDVIAKRDAQIVRQLDFLRELGEL